MLDYLTESWVVFQSPILVPTWHPPANTPDTPIRVFDRPLSFFAELARFMFPDTLLLTPQTLVHRFPPFRHFTTASHHNMLYEFLLECRTHHINHSFMEFVTTVPLSQSLQALLFLCYEYHLFTETTPNTLDPWELLTRLSEHRLPFGHFTWVHYPDTSTFYTHMIQRIASLVPCTEIIVGPSIRRRHTIPMSRFIHLAKRLPSTKWHLCPSSWSKGTLLTIATQAPCAPPPMTNDIYGYLRDQLEHAMPVTHPLHTALSDHVLPDALIQDPLWKHHSTFARNIDALSAETDLWLEHIFLTTLKTEKLPPHIVAVSVLPPWFPSSRELTFLAKAKLHLSLSPTPDVHLPIRTDSMVWLTPDLA